MIAFVSLWIQDLPNHEQALLLDPYALQLGKIYRFDSVNSFLLEEVQPSYADGHTSFEAYRPVSRDGFTV